MLCSVAVFLQGTTLTGNSTSSNVGITFVSSVSVTADIVAKPEKRIPSTGNDSTLLTVEVRTAGTDDVRYATGVVTQNDGTYPDLTLDVGIGTYDIAAKGYSHLRRTLTNVQLADGVEIDFTDGGDDPLLSGDVNGSEGDNKVNGIDLTLIVGDLTSDDERTDLNRDGLVNGIDLTNAVANLNVTGDS